MIIKPSDFENGGEIDCCANFRHGERKGRLSIRRSGKDYELYIKYHQFPRSMAPEEVLVRGSLSRVVHNQNDLLGYNDQVAV